MIIHFTDSEYGVIVAALARARHDLDGLTRDIDSALRKFDSWATPTGGQFTVVTGDDALRVRSSAPAGRRPRSQARAAMSREQHAQLPHTGDLVRAIHEQHGPGTLTLTVKSSALRHRHVRRRRRERPRRRLHAPIRAALDRRRAQEEAHGSDST